jgi:Pyridine nucleotide-disulphide oxidoreductase
MSFWERQMPKGMLLRSPWEASHIADPENQHSLDQYRTLGGNERLTAPVPLRDFVQYGLWFHDQERLSAEGRKVIRIDRITNGFELSFNQGETLQARRVVVATGLQPFANRPKLFENLPPSLVTHTSEHQDFGRFKGKEILVIGGGQSAIESAALVSENGAQVEVIVRKPTVHWLGRHQWMHAKAIAWMLYGRGDVGPAGVSLLVQRPNLFRLLPRRIQDRWGVRAIRPAAARWLRPRTQGMTIHTNCQVAQARVVGTHLEVHCNDGSERTVDHVILGTGYRVNIALYSFLPPPLLRLIDLADGYPRLGAGFESSIPGLHFLGAPAAWSFGPLMKFVAGTGFTSRALTSRILQAKKAQRSSRQSSLSPLESFEWRPSSTARNDNLPS